MAPDAVTVIKRDHRVIEALFDRLRDPSSDRAALVEEVAARFAAHARAEEDHVYPALAKADPSDADELHHGVDEHHEAEELLEELRDTEPDSPDFQTALQELVDAVRHHVEEEEAEILPQLAESVDRTRLVELGRAFEDARLRELREAGFDADGGAGDVAEMTHDEVLDMTQEAEIPGRSQHRRDELVQGR
jgi:hypothetical protein